MNAMQEFSQRNRKRCEAATGFDQKLSDWSASDWITAIAGEVGEAANIVKKLNRYRDGIRGNKETITELREKLRRELADVFIYLDLFAQSEGWDLYTEAQRKWDETSERIGYTGDHK